jgi:hypothetical protein
MNNGDDYAGSLRGNALSVYEKLTLKTTIEEILKRASRRVVLSSLTWPWLCSTI